MSWVLSFLIRELRSTGKLFILMLGSVRVAVYLVLCPILLTAGSKYSSYLDFLEARKTIRPITGAYDIQGEDERTGFVRP